MSKSSGVRKAEHFPVQAGRGYLALWVQARKENPCTFGYRSQVVGPFNALGAALVQVTESQLLIKDQGMGT